MELRVLDINVWHGLYAKSPWRTGRLESPEEQESRRRALVAAVRELDPHAITIQESFPQPDLTERLAKDLDMDEVHAITNAGVRVLGRGFPLSLAASGEGMTILAKRGLGLRGLPHRALSGFGWTHRAASFQVVPRRLGLAAEIDFEGRRVVFANTHIRYEFATREALQASWRALAGEKLVPAELPSTLAPTLLASLEARDRELDAFLSFVEDLGRDSTHVVVGADLNVDDDAPQLATPGWRRLTNVLPATGDVRRTWDPETNAHIVRSARYDHVDGQSKTILDLLMAHHDRLPQRPDHVLLGPTFDRSSIVDARVVLDRAKDVLPSDHYGIFVVLRV